MRTVRVKVDDLYLILGFVNVIKRSFGGGRLVSDIHEMLHEYLHGELEEKEEAHGKGN